MKFAGPVVFHGHQGARHWQRWSAWPPVEGILGWDGSIRFWNDQEDWIHQAGFNLQLANSNGPDFRMSFRNHLRVIKRRYVDPGTMWVAPFVAPETLTRPIDFARDHREAVNMVGLALGNALRDILSFLGGPEWIPEPVPGKRLVLLWAFGPTMRAALRPDSLSRIGTRIERETGITPYWSCHPHWGSNQPDQTNYLFADASRPFRPGTARCARILTGRWNSFVDGPGSGQIFVPRAGGATTMNGLRQAVARRKQIDWLYVESWNEITENSHICRSLPIDHRVGDAHPSGDQISVADPVHKPVHRVARNDSWGATPAWYIRMYARELPAFYRPPTQPPPRD